MANCWYVYNGVGNPNSAVSYALVSQLPPCLNGPNLCAIFAPSCLATPTSPLSAALLAAIAAARATQTAQYYADGTLAVAMKN